MAVEFAKGSVDSAIRIAIGLLVVGSMLESWLASREGDRNAKELWSTKGKCADVWGGTDGFDGELEGMKIEPLPENMRDGVVITLRPEDFAQVGCRWSRQGGGLAYVASLAVDEEDGLSYLDLNLGTSDLERDYYLKNLRSGDVVRIEISVEPEGEVDLKSLEGRVWKVGNLEVSVDR